MLELLTGGELFEKIKSKHSFKEKEALLVMKNILEALAYVHSKNIVHRDLKPENLIFRSKDNDSDVIIADFGLASFVRGDEKLHLPCGSPGYVAPEVLEDSGEGYGTKSDIFSVGVILYVMLIGSLCFSGRNYREIIRKNREAKVKYP